MRTAQVGRTVVMSAAAGALVDCGHRQSPDSAPTEPIGAGQRHQDCLTFLVPGGIKTMSYYGTVDYIDSPVAWAPS